MLGSVLPSQAYDIVIEQIHRISRCPNFLSIRKPQATEPAFLSSTKDCSCSPRGALPFVLMVSPDIYVRNGRA